MIKVRFVQNKTVEPSKQVQEDYATGYLMGITCRTRFFNENAHIENVFVNIGGQEYELAKMNELLVTTHTGTVRILSVKGGSYYLDGMNLDARAVVDAFYKEIL